MVLNVFPAIIASLEEIIETEKRRAEVIAEANGLLTNMQKFEFVLNLLIWRDILTHVNILSKYLQDPNMDVQNASDLVKATESTFRHMRGDDFFKSKIEEAKKMANANNIDAQFAQARLKKKKKKMSGELAKDEPIKDPETWYRVNVYFKSLDKLSNQLCKRFRDFHHKSADFVFEARELQLQ